MQLGLAILGWGGFTAFFSHPVFIATVAAMFVAYIAALFSSGNLSSGEREDRGNRWVLAAFGVLAILGAYFSSYTDRYNFWVIDGNTVRWTGFVLLVAGSILRLWPVFVLGRRFSGLVAIQRDHQLVTTGIYRYVRNPSYLGLLVSSVGWALVFRAAVGVLLALLQLIPLIARISDRKSGCWPSMLAPNTLATGREPGGCCPVFTKGCGVRGPITSRKAPGVSRAPFHAGWCRSPRRRQPWS